MDYILSMALFVIPASITPGPNNIMILTSGLNHGIRKTLPHYIGIITGFPLMVIAVGLGLSQVFTEYPLIHKIIKYGGMAYLCYLAYKIGSTKGRIESGEKKKPFTYFEAALFQWVNPKAWVMAVTAVSTYTHFGEQFSEQVLTIAVTFMMFGGPCVALWLFFGASLKQLFKSDTHLIRFNITMAVLLVASLIPTLI